MREHDGGINYGGKKHNHLRCFSDDGWMMKAKQPGRRANRKRMSLKVRGENAVLSAGRVWRHILTSSLISVECG